MLCAKVKPLPGEVCVFAGPEGATSFMSTVFPGKKDWWTGHSSSHTAIWKMNFFNLSRWTCHLNENNFCNPSPYLSFQVKTSAWERLYLPLAVWQLTVKTFWMRCVTIITRFFFFSVLWSDNEQQKIKTIQWICFPNDQGMLSEIVHQQQIHSKYGTDQHIST